MRCLAWRHHPSTFTATAQASSTARCTNSISLQDGRFHSRLKSRLYGADDAEKPRDWSSRSCRRGDAAHLPLFSSSGLSGRRCRLEPTVAAARSSQRLRSRQTVAGFERMGTAFEGALAEERLADLISNGDAARLRTEALTVYEQLNADAAPRAPACDFVSLRASVLAARCIVRLEGAVPSLLERDTDARRHRSAAPGRLDRVAAARTSLLRPDAGWVRPARPRVVSRPRRKGATFRERLSTRERHDPQRRDPNRRRDPSRSGRPEPRTRRLRPQSVRRCSPQSR
jgi:hypothetical protein